MNKLPQPFWAVMLAVLGVTVCLCVLFHPTPENIALAVLAISSNLVSGSLGAFAGHAAAQNKADVTMGNGPLTINKADTE